MEKRPGTWQQNGATLKYSKDWAKDLQLNPEEIKNYVYLLKDRDGKTAWLMGALLGKVEVLGRLWDLAKELQLNSEEIKKDVYLLKDKDGKTAWPMAAFVA